ncbi:hypothetical protein XENORESO_009663, partial [Xenotaenia resolanae]
WNLCKVFLLVHLVLGSFPDSCQDIILGSHKEGGATTFWSYILNLPLSSNSMVSWKVCYLLHKMLREGHRNVVTDSHRHSRSIRDMGALWGNLHDRYGHIVALSAKYLHLKMEFHAKHKVIPCNLEVTDETLEREAGTDMTKVLDMTQELLEYLDAGLKMAETGKTKTDWTVCKKTNNCYIWNAVLCVPILLNALIPCAFRCIDSST